MCCVCGGGRRPAHSGNGRDRWVITKGEGDWYHIRPVGGNADGAKYLRVTQCTFSCGYFLPKVEVGRGDGSSGRARWVLTPAGSGAFKMRPLEGTTDYLVSVTTFAGLADPTTFAGFPAPYGDRDLWRISPDFVFE